MARIEAPGVGGSAGAGFIRYTNVETQSAAPVVIDTYNDPPNNTIPDEATVPELALRFTVESSSPNVTVDGNAAVLPKVGSIYQGQVDVTLASAGNVVAQAINPDGVAGATDTVAINLEAPPVITSAEFTGGYPGSQTELKEDDSFDIQVIADKDFDLIEIVSFAGGATKADSIGVPAGTDNTVTSTIEDNGDVAVARVARVRVRDAVTGAFSATFDTDTSGSVNGVNTVLCNDLRPTVQLNTIDYPGAQQALKGSETADINVTVADADLFTATPIGGELLVTDNTPPDLVVQRNGGTFNNSTDNLQLQATRNANDAVTTLPVLVVIANVAPTIDITVPAARLRSGGNNGTSAQDHTVTITSDQPLLSAPTLDADSGGNRGTFQGGGFAGGPSVWTRDLRVDETVPDEKGSFSFENLVAEGLAGVQQTSINSGAGYTLGGFVQRDLTFGPFATTVPFGTSVEDFSKLTAGIFTATNQPALKQSIGTSPPVTNGYTIDAVSVNPTTLEWLDTAAAGSNSGGTAQITNVEETA